MTHRGDTGGVDPFVQERVSATCGYLYRPLQHRLTRYPIPDLRLPLGNGSRLLDIGCNWGRWSIAAARKGYEVSGIDPNPIAILAARRIANQLALNIDYRSGSGQVVPYPEASFDVVFSYSVLQHLAKDRVKATIAEINRVLKPGGLAMVQMPNWLGVRSLVHQLKRNFREARNFEVRYWGLRELRQVFGVIGPSQLTVDGFFGLGIQAADLDLMPRRFRIIVRASDTLRKVARFVTPMIYVADSVYVTARKPPLSMGS